MKQCNKCKNWKDKSEFSKNVSGKNGLRARCRECCSAESKRYYQIHRIKCVKNHKEYRQTHKIERYKYHKEYCQTFIGCLRQRFAGMKQRCDNPKAVGYRYWGGRGIKCLFVSANEFIDYVVDILGYTVYEEIKGLQIDRIDNNGHYEPGNIQFVTQAENLKNKRKRIY